jgi:hypothetical protein
MPRSTEGGKSNGDKPSSLPRNSVPEGGNYSREGTKVPAEKKVIMKQKAPAMQEATVEAVVKRDVGEGETVNRGLSKDLCTDMEALVIQEATVEAGVKRDGVKRATVKGGVSKVQSTEMESDGRKGKGKSSKSSTEPKQTSTGGGKGGVVMPQPPPRSPVPKGADLSKMGKEAPVEKAPVLQKEWPAKQEARDERMDVDAKEAPDERVDVEAKGGEVGPVSLLPGWALCWSCPEGKQRACKVEEERDWCETCDATERFTCVRCGERWFLDYVGQELCESCENGGDDTSDRRGG